MLVPGGALLLGGREDQRASLLPRIAAGDLLASTALGGAGGRYEVESLGVTARQQGASLSLSGTADYVPSADLAELVLVAARGAVAGGPMRWPLPADRGFS